MAIVLKTAGWNYSSPGPWDGATLLSKNQMNLLVSYLKQRGEGENTTSLRFLTWGIGLCSVDADKTRGKVPSLNLRTKSS